jgi:hypothetical protein
MPIICVRRSLYSVSTVDAVNSFEYDTHKSHTLLYVAANRSQHQFLSRSFYHLLIGNTAS